MELIYSLGEGGRLRCGRCGNENSEANRFCGMCGAALVANAQPSSAAAPTVAHGAGAEPATRSSAEPRSATPVTRAASRSLSGIKTPSILGLSDPPSGPTTSSHDPLGRPSRNLDYLLEDEEPPSRGWGKLVLVVIALLLAGGFGYLRWKQGGFDWVTKERKPPAAVDSTQSKTDSGGTSGASAPGAGTAASNPAGATATPDTAVANAASPGSGGTAAMPPPASGPANTSTPAPSQSASAENAAQAKPAEANAADNPAAAPADSASTTKTAKTGPSAGKTPERKPTPVTPVDTAAEAERYVYGRGVRQDCDHGLRLLKPAAQANAKAMITMGVMYSTGTCTPRDLPTAYRWFAMALHKEPDNVALQDDLQKLWGQMTPPERQLAIKLSQ